MKLNFPNEPLVVWKGRNSIPRGCIISCVKVCKMIYKGCLYHIVRVKNLHSEITPIESVLVMSEFPDIFPNDLPGIPLKRILILVSIFYHIQITFNYSLLDDFSKIEIVEGTTKIFTRLRLHKT